MRVLGPPAPDQLWLQHRALQEPGQASAQWGCAAAAPPPGVHGPGSRSLPARMASVRLACSL